MADFELDSPATAWHGFADTTNINRSRQLVADAAETTRRDFLMIAGIGTAAATLIRPGKLFAAGGTAKPQKILVPAAWHAAMQSAARRAARRMGWTSFRMRCTSFCRDTTRSISRCGSSSGGSTSLPRP